jgi:hypothetical protein
MTTISKFKWFWAWQDEKEEAWLHEMAKQGLHLQRVGPFGYYEFTEGEPRYDYYRMDYIFNRKDYENYLQLFKDAGWEHLGQMGGWQYFRTSAKGAAVPEIYTDKDSKAQKYQRLLTILVILLPMYISLTSRRIISDGDFWTVYLIGKAFLSFILLLYIYAMIRIFQRIQQLKGK